MALLLGVDTGGTYTDAVLIEGDAVIASAKSLTTRHDLAIGVGGAVRAVLVAAGCSADEVRMASLSTTLATNALVEGQGGRIGLVLIGFGAADMDRHGLREALRGDPHCTLAGGHLHSGTEAAPLDEGALRAFLAQAQVGAFAVAAQFATRNPAHELRAAEIIAEVTGKPVSASHQLSAKLGGPKRALTALLNARLVGMIARLIGRAEDVLREIGVTAPLMVVRGDGALMSSAQARARPIETILSGPAASLVGARWLTGAADALVSDIGGTTTDVAMLRAGRPAIDPDGAQVGPFRTMVEAVAMRTTGLGGDSEVHRNEGLAGGVTLGPRRTLPVSLIAAEAPEVVLPTLDRQVRSTVPSDHDGRFVRAVQGQNADGLAARDAALLERIGGAVHPLGDVLRSRMDHAALRRLVDRGLVQIAAVTPSDAAHVLGWLDVWNAEAARMALTLLARRRTGAGIPLAEAPEALATMIVDQLTDQTGLALLEAAFAEDGALPGDPSELARHALMQAGLQGHKGLVRIETGLGVPVVGLGASAQTYYPAVGALMGTQMILPEHAGVANAVGAVVGQITVRRAGTVTAQGEGRVRAHLAQGPSDHAEAEPAMQAMEQALSQEARDAARAAGAQDVTVHVTRDVRGAEVEARQVFVEATITVEATGRPRIADDEAA
ncbi:MAG: hydantoinase/oxoprolinase family protein [Pseudomonadota bacterium]